MGSGHMGSGHMSIGVELKKTFRVLWAMKIESIPRVEFLSNTMYSWWAHMSLFEGYL